MGKQLFTHHSSPVTYHQSLNPQSTIDNRQWIFAVLLLLCLVLLLPDEGAAQGCAMCRTVGASRAASTAGFNGSILFLAAMPYILAGLVAGWVLYGRRRGQGR
jgi:hypothetical protein